MLPLFGDNRRRQINLGGASSASTHADILDQARIRREERQDLRRRQENAVRVQAWWRSIVEARAARRRMRQMFDADVTGIIGLRCLVTMGRDEEALGIWSNTMLQLGQETLLRPSTGPDRESWLVLIRQASLLLLTSVVASPHHPYAIAHLQVLAALLSKDVTEAYATHLSAEITRYLLARGYYKLLAQAVGEIVKSPQSKSSPSLPLLIPLSTLPLSASDASSSQYSQSFSGLVSSILSIPLLLSRLPLESLTKLSAGIPFSNLSTIHIPTVIESTSPLEQVHLIANLTTLTAPRYSKLSAQSLDAYFGLLTALFNALPVNSLNPPPPGKKAAQVSSWGAEQSDSDEEQEAHVSVVTSFTPSAPPLPSLDERTLKRLHALVTPTHIGSILAASTSHPRTRTGLVIFLLALTTVWPAERDAVLSAVQVRAGGGLVRELFRGHVRGSVLGRDDNPGALFDPANEAAWPPLVFLADLYTQYLLTMGDDEFFGTTKIATSQRNPLTLDDVTTFTRQLLNVAFTLYWREDQTYVQERVVGTNLRLTWQAIREKATKCLVAIHARDSRKPFMPEGHWLVGSQLNIKSFVDAVVYEERQLLEPNAPAPRYLSKRQIAQISPRLGILNNIPFAIPFEARVAVFRHFVESDKHSLGVGRFTYEGRQGRMRVEVRRGSVAQDGFDRLGDADLKAPVEIVFIDQFGQEEAGVDGGGVFKEFFTSLCKEVFDTDRGLWLATAQNELYPNPHAYAIEGHSLNWYRFIGRILGKAMYEGILVDVAFAGFFLSKWLGKQSFLDDLASLDPDLYAGLIFLKHYTGNPEDLSLNFTVVVEEFGVAKSVDLVPNGSNIAVTKENRLQYIHLISHYRLSKQIKLQSDAFFEGLSEIIDPRWLRMFNQQEVQILLGGVNAPIDLDDLRAHTQYGGVFDDKHPSIEAFWDVVNTFNHDERRALLRFVTSCSRPPLLGFKELVPNFAIRDSGTDQQRLPTSSTCVNLLKMPQYASPAALRAKLVQAITSGAGFDLS